MHRCAGMMQDDLDVLLDGEEPEGPALRRARDPGRVSGRNDGVKGRTGEREDRAAWQVGLHQTARSGRARRHAPEDGSRRARRGAKRTDQSDSDEVAGATPDDMKLFDEIDAVATVLNARQATIDTQ